MKIIVSTLGKEIVENTSNRIFINDKDFKNNNFTSVEDAEVIEKCLITFLQSRGPLQCSTLMISIPDTTNLEL